MALTEPSVDLRNARAHALRGIESAVARVMNLSARGRRTSGDLIGAKEAMAAGRWDDAARGWIAARRHPLPIVRATADLMLGTLLTEHLGQREHGKRSFERAWRSRHPAVAHVAAHSLARFRLEDGDRAGAQLLYRWAWHHGEGRLRWRSAEALIRLLQSGGDDVAAAHMITMLQRSAAATSSADGWETIASLRRHRGELEEAEAAYRAALDAGPTDAAFTHGCLGRVLSKQGKLKAALRELELAGGPTGRIFFLYELAKVRQRLGDSEEACDAYADVLQVTDSEFQNLRERDDPGHDVMLRSDPRPSAAIRLGRLRESMGEVEAARDALAYATDHGTATVAAAAWLARARLERRVGDRSAARAAYANAIHVKGGAYPAAELGLARLLIIAKQLGAAQQLLDRLVGCGDERIAALAAVQRKKLLSALDETDTAREQVTRQRRHDR